VPHDQGWEQAATVRRAAELNQRPVALLATYRPDGSLPQRASFLSVDRPNIVLSVLKRAEAGNGLILRAYETDKVATRAAIRLGPWGRTVEADFGPCEIKTFRIPGDPAAPVVETNMIELDGPA
jgi:alpha-mannosidase